MSGSKRFIAIVLAVFVIAGLVGAIVSALLGIWTGDDRWVATAWLFGPTSLVIGVVAGSYPGWDW